MNNELQQEINERKKVEDAFRESEEKYRSLIENINIGIYRRRYDGKFLAVNTTLAKLLGYKSVDEVLSLSVVDLYTSPERKQQFENELLKNDIVRNWEEKIRKKDGSVFIANITTSVVKDSEGNIKYFDGIIDDITEKKDLEEQLFQIQKMESIGRLAGGIAHDFNNILVGIMGYAELLKLHYPDPESFEGEAAEVIFKGTNRAADLTKQLLGFARKGKYNPVSLNINEVIEETIKVSEKIFEKKISIVFEFEDNILNMEGDLHQIEQVLTNLFINAKDAMPGGGKLIIKTENTIMDEPILVEFPEFKQGDYVKISVADTGVGIRKSIEDRIFEPFFTTKSEGKGTGLGLATVYGIIKIHNGHIQVNSKPGYGTKFILYFPVTIKPEFINKEDEPVFKGNATILVVDDVPDVRKLSEKMMKKLGFNVLLAGSGKEVVQIYTENKKKITLIVLDMIMPDMDGKETLVELRKINSEIKVLLSSGFSKDNMTPDTNFEGFNGFIQKPYKIHQLSSAIQKALTG